MHPCISLYVESYCLLKAGNHTFFLSTIAQYMLLSSISDRLPSMRFPAEIPPSIPTAPQEHILKSCTCLLSSVSLHFLQ